MSWFGTLAAMYFAAAAVSLSNVFFVPGFFAAKSSMLLWSALRFTDSERTSTLNASLAPLRSTMDPRWAGMSMVWVRCRSAAAESAAASNHCTCTSFTPATSSTATRIRRTAENRPRWPPLPRRAAALRVPAA